MITEAGPSASAMPVKLTSGLRLIDSCITQLKAQGPSRTCNESKEEEEKSERRGGPAFRAMARTFIVPSPSLNGPV